jgi:hypothetical protein
MNAGDDRVRLDRGGWISGPCLPEPLPGSVAWLTAMFSEWDIKVRPGGLDVITAEHRSADGRSIRYIVASTAGELARKLETAETVRP